MKQYTAIIFIITLVCVCYVSAVQDYSTIENDVFVRPQRPAAIFDHDDHNETAKLGDDCSICHHYYEEKKLIEDQSSEDSPCSDCHNIKPSLQNSVPLRMAFHKQCKNCHFKSGKGPVLCGDCHIKKARAL